MIGRTARSAVVHGLLVGLCLCEPLHAGQNAQIREPQQSQTEEQDLETLRSAAEQGDAEVQFNLGLMYEQGQGVPQDYAEAVRWYRLAAEQGFTAAQVNLGMMYAQGRGVSQDRVAAHMWLSLAVAQASDADRDTFVEARDAIAEEMSAEQIAEAQRLARE